MPTVTISPTVSPTVTAPELGSSGRYSTFHGAVSTFRSLRSSRRQVAGSSRSTITNASVTQNARCTPTDSAPPMPSRSAEPIPAPDPISTAASTMPTIGTTMARSRNSTYR